MSEEKTPDGRPPCALQRLLDNPWILLVLGILIPTLSYTVWGLVELVLLPPAKLP